MSYCKYCNDVLKIVRNKNYREGEIPYLSVQGFVNLYLEKLYANEGMYNNDEDTFNIKFSESELINADIDKVLKACPNKSELEIRANMKNFYDELVKDTKSSDLFVLLCSTCGSSYHLKPNTIIDSLNLEEHIVNYDEAPEIRFNDPTLFRTKNYICINKKCKTNTDMSDKVQIEKEAVFYKLGKSHNVKYICGCCKTTWST